MTPIDLTNPYLAGLLVVAGIDLGMAAYAITRREQQGARPVALLLVGAGLWALTYVVQLATVSPTEANAMLAVSMATANMLAVGVLGFGVEYTGRRTLVTRFRRHLAQLVALVALVAGLTNPAHGALWTLEGVTVRHGLTIWTVTWRAGALVYGLWLVGVAAVGIAFVVQLVRTTRGLYRRQLGPFAASLAVLMTANAVSLLGLVPIEGLWLTPYATGLGAVAFAVGALRLDLFERSPVSPSRAHDVAIELLGTPVVVVDGDGTLVHYNPSADGLFVPDADAVGDPLGEHLPALAERLAAADDAFEDDLVETARGRRRHVEVAATPMPPGWVVSLHDVTDRVLREQRIAVLYRLLRHNVRNKTSIVVGYGDRVAASDDEELAAAGEAIVDAGEALTGVSEGARRMNSLLEVDTELQVVDAAGAVRGVVEEQQEANSDVNVRFDAPDQALTRCHVSVREAVAELVENAIVHHDGDHPNVEVHVADGDDWVTVTVADDGPGIPEGELAAIREGRESQLVHASGVGLWLVSWATTASGGEVSFEENDPRGSVVRLRLPAA